MNEAKERAVVQNAVNRRLSGLQENPFLAQRIMSMEKGETKVRRKPLKTCLIITAVLVLLSITAYAIIQGTGLFSPRTDAKVLANQALYDQYGLTSSMLGFFSQDAQSTDDHHWRVDYVPTESIVARLGTYRVEITDGHVDQVTWSKDGLSTVGGFDAEAWGAAQLEEMVKITSKTHDMDRFDRKIRGEDVDLYEGVDDAAPGEKEQREAEQFRDVLDEAGKEIESQSKYTREELVSLGRQAIIDRYGLGPEQQDRLHLYDSEWTISYYKPTGSDETPAYHMTFQIGGSGEWTAGDGFYEMDINILDGTAVRNIRDEMDELGKESKAQARYSREELIAIGRQGIIQAYNLNTDQQERLQFYDTNAFPAYYSTIGADHRPTYSMTFQSRGEGGWTEGDGVYTIIINVLTGTVEYLDYDTTLGGNG